MADDLAAKKAIVVTYEKELQQILAEMKQAATTPQTAEPMDEESRNVAAGVLFLMFFQNIARRIDLMEKYEAAQRDYAKALEARVKALEKENARYQPRLER